jgi:hypothetical protein
MRYIVIDSTNMIINAADWDGIAPWPLPSGCQAILDDPATQEAGNIYVAPQGD